MPKKSFVRISFLQTVGSTMATSISSRLNAYKQRTGKYKKKKINIERGVCFNATTFFNPTKKKRKKKGDHEHWKRIGRAAERRKRKIWMKIITWHFYGWPPQTRDNNNNNKNEEHNCRRFCCCYLCVSVRTWWWWWWAPFFVLFSSDR